LVRNPDLDIVLREFLAIPSPDGRNGVSPPGNGTHPRISVITPSFNQARFIERTIRSVLNQGWPNLEYIVIDGASTDGSREIIRRYEPYLSRWFSEPDRGQTDAILKGLGHATGEYVTWICSDDVLFPGSLERMAGALAAHPEAGIVYGGVAFIDEEDRILKVRSYPDMDLSKLLYERHSTVAQPSSLIRRKTLDEAGGLDRTLSYCMDYDLWIRLLRVSGCVNLGETVLSGYRLHTRSKTVGSYRKMALEKIAVNRRYTGDRINKVIYAHYWYMVEDFLRTVRRTLLRSGDARE
jgi:glycosyltransferase involved in cell wall biosynthesis